MSNENVVDHLIPAHEVFSKISISQFVKLLYSGKSVGSEPADRGPIFTSSCKTRLHDCTAVPFKH